MKIVTTTSMRSSSSFWRNVLHLVFIPSATLCLICIGLLVDRITFGEATGGAEGFIRSVTSETAVQSANALQDLSKTMSSGLFAMFTVSILMVQLAVLRFTPMIIHIILKSTSLIVILVFMLGTELLVLIA
jgi:hypothetical protein